MTFEELRARLAKLDASCLSDPDKTIRAVDPAIRPVRTGLVMVGRAFTVACDDDFLGVRRRVYRERIAHLARLDHDQRIGL